ncbi:MAG: alkaline phosphatase family protein [Sphingobacteriales bacterium]|nr:MAG: alkaline phosphatase family protein [Sphingobacteriales bacterium]
MALFKKLPKLLRWVIISMLVLLLMMFLYRIFFFYTYSKPGRPLPGSAILLGLRYDARMVSAIGLGMLVLGFIPFLNPFKNAVAKKIWPVILTLVFFVFVIAYVSDFYYYDYLQERLNASILNFIEDAAISFTMMRQTYPVITIIVLMIAVLFIYWWLNKKLVQKIDKTAATVSHKNLKWYFIPAVLLLGALVFGRLGQYPLRWSDAFSLGDDFKGNTALNPFQSFLSSLKFKNSSYDIKKVREVYPLMADYFGVQQPNAEKLNYDRTFQFADSNRVKPNVVVVICESFSMYKSSMSGNPLDATPYFNELVKKGIFFDRCFSPSIGTARGVWATVTGIPDVETPTTASRNPANVSQHTIINDFTGYSKSYFLGGSTTWANIRGVLTNNIDGLKIFEEGSFDAPREDVWGISDKNLFLAANKELAKETGPFFSIIQTAGNHRPYTIPAEDLKEFKKVEFPLDTLLKYGYKENDELNAFRYSDYCFKKFFEAASKEKYFNNTIFVFVGDHGVTGNAGGLYPQSFTKQGLTASHVPLLFYAPELLPAQRIAAVCSQADLLPSIAALARLPHTNTTMGRNLFDTTVRNNWQPFSFNNNPSTHFISLVNEQYYYGKNIETGVVEFASVLNNEPVPANAATDSAKKKMALLTEAFNETAKYLLQHNKKRSLDK